MLSAIDIDALNRAITDGVCEPVDFVTPLPDPNFYLGINVEPGHIAAGLKCVYFDTKNFSNSRSSSNLGHNCETNRCGSALIRSMKALQASKRWRMEA